MQKTPSSAIVHALVYGNRSMHDADPASLVRRAYSTLTTLLHERYPTIDVERLDSLLLTEDGQGHQVHLQHQIEDSGAVADLDVLLSIIELQDALARHPTPSAIGLAMENVRAGRITISDIAVTQIQGKEPPTPGSPPYKGLAYFDVADAWLFFGREELSAELVNLLWNHRFLAVVGASGSGKSSLVRAGVIPTLRGEKALANDASLPPGSQSWPYLIIRPKEDGLQSLAQAMLSKTKGISLEQLLSELQADRTTLYRYTLQWEGAQEPEARLLLVVDQFEEIFRIVSKGSGEQEENLGIQAERRNQALIQNLTYAAERDGPVTVILTVRADFYGQCIAIEELRGAFNGELATGSRQVNVGPLTSDELRRVIEGPLTAVDPVSKVPNNWSIEPELVTQLLADVGREPGALPLLSHALLATWKRRSGRTLSVAGYITTGRVQGAIATTADAVYEKLNSHEQRLLRVLFLGMTRTLDGEHTTAWPIRFDRMLADTTTAKERDRVLEELQKARLVVVSHQENDRGAGEVVELAHEALTRVWPLLRSWIQKGREQQAIYHRLIDGFDLWSASGDSSDLYRGQRLKRAFSLLQTEYRSILDEQVRAFLEQSQKQEKAEHLRRRLWMLVALLLFLVVAAVILTPIIRGRWQQQKALDLNPTVPIPAGEALLGTNDRTREAAIRQSYPQRSIALGAFSIHQYEISNQQYELCVRAGVCLPPKGMASAEELSRLDSLLPVVNVPLKQASQFCKWLGGRLPTESEWERAARGAEGRLWPWGDSLPTLQQVNIAGSPEASLAAVNDPYYQSGATPEGIMHLVGNATEWTATPDSCRTDAYCNDQWDEKSGVMVRGGSVTDDLGGWQSITSASVYDGEAYSDIGFRCAFDE